MNKIILIELPQTPVIALACNKWTISFQMDWSNCKENQWKMSCLPNSGVSIKREKNGRPWLTMNIISCFGRVCITELYLPFLCCISFSSPVDWFRCLFFKRVKIQINVNPCKIPLLVSNSISHQLNHPILVTNNPPIQEHWGLEYVVIWIKLNFISEYSSPVTYQQDW